jgi:hypothetical protein
MGLFSALDAGLYSKLTGYAAGTAFYGLRVYDTLATQSVAHPYVVFQAIGGGDTNEYNGRFVDVEYRVECIGTTQADAKTGAGHIEDALHNAALTVSGWTWFASTQVQVFSRTDNVDGKLYHRRGGFYRFRLAK